MRGKRIALALVVLASFGWFVADVRAEVLPGNSTLIGILDYSDTFTLGTANRPTPLNTLGGHAPASYLIVETAYHGLPSVSFADDYLQFTRGGIDTASTYPGNTGNSGAETGIAQSYWGINNTFAYGQRIDFVIQVDAINLYDRLDIYSGSTLAGGKSDGPKALTVFIRKEGMGYPQISLYNPTYGEKNTGFTTDIANSDKTWHNFAVRFKKTDTVNELYFYVDQVLKGMLDLTTFESGHFANYSNAYVGASHYTGANYGWMDNFQIGAPIPEPSTLALLAAGAIGMLVYAWRKRK